MPDTEIYGIRHHGPGSARALRRALEDFKPDVVLIEGPPEADAIVHLAADPAMRPPVALLAYTSGPTPKPGTPPAEHAPTPPDPPGRRAAFWPFAEFSPEWQAIRYAVEAGIPIRFCDLPAAHQLAETPELLTGPPATDPHAADDPAKPSVSDTHPSGRHHADGETVTNTEDDRRHSPNAAGQRSDRRDTGTGVKGQHDVGGRAAEVSTADVEGRVAGGRDPARGAEAAGRWGSGGEEGDAVRGDARASLPGRAAEGDEVERVRLDPLGWLAQVAGYDDAERWWEDVVEHRGEGPSPFPAIAEAMTVLREDLEERPVRGVPEAYARRERQREAYMRRTLRRTLKEGYERVAVVCGAWHVPALQAQVPASADDRTLRGLPKEKVALTWVPWTHGRLAHWSGYGAGVRSPGWYHHLFTAPDRPIERWLTRTARLLREEDLHVSSAHVIEGVRLAETLAALRDRPLAGLDEVTEATRAVLCEGAEAPLELVRHRLVVGERLGAVPESTPMVPLQRDVQAEQRRLRLKPSAPVKEHDLDLRTPLDLDRSRLLHRLRLLGVAWGEPDADASRSKGTFREGWRLAWRPEFDVELIEAGVWGTTVRDAAGARARALAGEAATLADLTSVAERCLLADLGEALPAVMRALADLAATDVDVVHLMAALPALVRALRYGDVRGTSVEPLRTVVDGLVVRICVGLPPAVSGLDDDAARDLLRHIDAVQESVALLAAATSPGGAAGGERVHRPGPQNGPGGPGHEGRWHGTLAGLLDRPGLHGLIDGRLTRLLHDAGLLDDVADRMARAVSVGHAPARAAAWIEGFLSGGGLVLVHDNVLLRLVDGWIAGLPEDSFTDVLPLLRRTFGGYGAAERRALGERARRVGGATTRRPEPDEDLDLERALPAVRAVAGILGWPT
ncbi:DUF5682 family protein [Thermomonospora umbrina]|uniref:Uncharacterized protein n=1 Tax=Thermomonospora umbrina TaxID=111806 RepID=A0A3D9SPZ5_9ACTN|nr:DUF5682 family protein [Thermomonospora umbrina]REE95005.1 hypothetical protein DFJ69_0375 [Thermomonospora umbrina]